MKHFSETNSIKNQPSKVSEGLYLSGFFEARYKEVLKQLGITHILVAGQSLQIVFPDVFDLNIK